MKSVLFLSLALAGGSFAFGQHNHGAATAAPAAAPASTCPVSGDKLGAMGDPVTYVYKQAGKPDRVLQFCCKDCIKDFEKDPAKYLAILDGKTAQAKPGAKSDSAMAGCCGDANDDCCALVRSYVAVADALAADNFEQARAAAATLAKQAGAANQKPVYNAALAVIHADSIGAARKAFKDLSKAVVPLAQGSKEFVVMNCPMANADWVQTDTKVRNPYYGKSMLTCGAPKTAAQ